ncbi:MAG: hypothetical protein IRZ08_08595 [Frankia sp.]|nr:hypothetical protein [Frankia sp.]
MSRYDYGDFGDRRGYREEQRYRPQQPPRRQSLGYRPDQSAHDDRPGRDAHAGYQPYAQPPPGYGYGPRPKKRRWPLFLALGVVACGLAGCVAFVVGVGSSVESTSSGDPATQAQGLFQHPEDVSISACEPDELGMMSAQVLVTNQSSKASDYSIQVSFQSPDGTQSYADGYAIITTLAAGQQRPETVQSFKEAPGPFRCVVVSVQRTQSL